jgi:hypothetical protein
MYKFTVAAEEVEVSALLWAIQLGPYDLVKS